MRAAFDEWRRGGRTYRHRGHAIFYRTEGQGPDLLLIHGFPSASWDWHELWPDLTARFRVIAADMIGFGWSDKPPRHAYSILDQAELLAGLLAELGVERVHVLAHDYGDTVAQELLARHEEGGRPSLRSVCFLNGGLFPETHRSLLVQRLLAGPLGPLVGRLTSQRLFARGMTRVFGPRTPPGAELLDELWALLEHGGGRRVLHRLIGYMAERRRHRERWVSVLGRTRIPLHVIDGAADPVSGAHMVARWRELVPAGGAVELPGIGHYPQLEDAPAVLREFLAFHARL